MLDDVNVPTNDVAPVNVVVPATYKLPIPAPPLTLNAPVEVDDDVSVELVWIIFDDVNVPTNVVEPVNVVVPATNKLPKPAPPETCNAPVVVDDEGLVAVVMILSDEVIVPTETISFDPIVKLPFNTVALFNVDVPLTNKLPIPAPPLTLSAPVEVDDDVSVDVV